MEVYTKADKWSKFCQRCAHLWQNLLDLYAFVYSSLMTTLWRSKHIGGTKVTNDYLLLTTYSGRIQFADATSLFYSTCYAHEVICEMCGWFDNCWRAGGSRDPCPVTPCSLLFLFARPWELKIFLPSQFPCALAELSSWAVVMSAGRQEWDARYLVTYSAGA